MSLLKATGLRAGYGRIDVLRGIDLEVPESKAIVILGANGAGKTTTLRVLSGMLSATGGSLTLDGKDVLNADSAKLVRSGLAHVPQGRGTFGRLSVEDNLRLGGYTRSKQDVRDGLEQVYELFPRLLQRRTQQAGGLSGGEQQMVAIGRALMLRPRLLLLDEPSLGLAPKIVAELYSVLARLRAESDTAMLVVEQNAKLALDLADHVYILESGEIALNGSPELVQQDSAIRKAYLGY